MAAMRRLQSMAELHEPWLDRAFAACMAASDGAFVDVGANMGQTLAKVIGIDPVRRYVGFEPQVGCVAGIERLIREAGLTNCQIVAAGLDETSGLRRLYRRTERVGDQTASMIAGFRPESFFGCSSVITVMNGDVALDSLGIGEISTIKIDVEGAEIEVLKGLPRAILRSRPFIVFEMLNNFLAATGETLDEATLAERECRAAALSDYFRDRDYRIFNIRNQRLVEVGRLRPEVSGDLSITDYVGAPAEKVDLLRRHYRGEVVLPA